MDDTHRDKPHSRALRVGRVSADEAMYFVTKRVADQSEGALADPICARVVIDSFMWMQDRGWVKVLGLVIMPDHYHIVAQIIGSRSLSSVMSSVDGFSAWEMNKLTGRCGRVWQEGYHDRMIRDAEEYELALQYIHLNPVRAGLCEQPDEWPYSTANWEHSWLLGQW